LGAAECGAKIVEEYDVKMIVEAQQEAAVLRLPRRNKRS
jgi:hypothetical protein